MPALKTLLCLNAISHLITNAPLRVRKSACAQTHGRTRFTECTQVYACTIAAFVGTQGLCGLLYACNHAKVRTNPVCTSNAHATVHADTRTQTHAHAQTNARTCNSFFCVGGERVRTRSDANVSIENFQDVLYVYVVRLSVGASGIYYCLTNLQLVVETLSQHSGTWLTHALDMIIPKPWPPLCTKYSHTVLLEV